MNDREKYLDYYVKNETNLNKLNLVEMVRNFGLNVARLRSELGFTQNELSRMTGINPSTLVRIELGNIKHIDLFAACKLSTFFRVPIIKLIGQGDNLMNLYTNLIMSSARTQRLVSSILAADVQMRSIKSAYDPKDMITKITFAEPFKDGINATRFLFEQDNISEFKNYSWYEDAHMLAEINSNYYHPLYHIGDRLVVVDRPPSNGEIGVFVKGNRMYIRRFIETPDSCRLEHVCRPINDLTDMIVDRHSKTDMGQYIKVGTIVAVI